MFLHLTGIVYKISVILFITVSVLSLSLNIWYRYSIMSRYFSESEKPTSLGPSESNIFFIKTSEDGQKLTKRELCVVNSAAKTNPDSKIWVIMMGSHTKYRNHIKNNVRVISLNMNELLQDSPLTSWYHQRDWTNMNCTELLKALLLWKYGGVYFDWDYIITRSIMGMKNFVFWHENNSGLVNPSILGISVEETTNRLAWMYVNDMQSLWKLNVSRSESSYILTKTLKSFCGTNKLQTLEPDGCWGFTIAHRKNFYVEYSHQESHTDEYDDNYAVHLTKDIEDSELKRYCPEMKENT